MKRRPYLLVKPAVDGTHWWFCLMGGNHQVTMASETYPTKSNAMRAARRFRDVFVILLDPPNSDLLTLPGYERIEIKVRG